jgi:hypothetical protein
LAYPVAIFYSNICLPEGGGVMNKGFKYEIEKPWIHGGAPEFHKVTFDGKELSLKQLAELSEQMRLELLKHDIIVRLEKAE